MKKALCLIMAIAMILSMSMISVYAEDILLIAPAPAPEGTAITDAAGFAAMDPAGTYYLANNITISEPYAQAFTGTFDGNGKTVTISQPMFADFGGKIKNLTVEGSVTALGAEAEIAIFTAEGARGAVAATVKSGTEVVFENIVNNAVKNGAQIAVDEINALGGMQFELNMQDDEHDPEKAVNAYGNLMDWGMQLSLLAVTSKPGEAISVNHFVDRVFGLTPSGIVNAVTWSAIAALYNDLSIGSTLMDGQYPGFEIGST